MPAHIKLESSAVNPSQDLWGFRRTLLFSSHKSQCSFWQLAMCWHFSLSGRLQNKQEKKKKENFLTPTLKYQQQHADWNCCLEAVFMVGPDAWPYTCILLAMSVFFILFILSLGHFHMCIHFLNVHYMLLRAKWHLIITCCRILHVFKIVCYWGSRTCISNGCNSGQMEGYILMRSMC